MATHKLIFHCYMINTKSRCCHWEAWRDYLFIYLLLIENWLSKIRTCCHRRMNSENWGIWELRGIQELSRRLHIHNRTSSRRWGRERPVSPPKYYVRDWQNCPTSSILHLYSTDKAAAANRLFFLLEAKCGNLERK